MAVFAANRFVVIAAADFLLPLDGDFLMPGFLAVVFGFAALLALTFDWAARLVFALAGFFAVGFAFDDSEVFLATPPLASLSLVNSLS